MLTIMTIDDVWKDLYLSIMRSPWPVYKMCRKLSVVVQFFPPIVSPVNVYIG